MSTTVKDGHETQQPWAIGVVVSVTALALISVILRITARYVRKAPFGLDDVLIICSMIWFLVVMAFIMVMVHYGMGLHADTLPPNNVVLVAKYLLVAEILYAVNLAITKISLLTMYYRVFPVGNFKLWAYGIGGFCIAWVITIIFVFIFICVPVQKLWYVDLPGHCVNQVATWCANAASTIATDVAILVLPMPRVWKLNMGKTQRIGLIIAFGLGFFVVFASAYRFTVLFGYTATDSTWTLTNVVAWTAIEISVGIVSACLPTLRPIARIVMNYFGVHSSSDTKDLASQSGTGSRLGFHEGTQSGTDSTRPFKKLDDTKLVPGQCPKITSKCGVGSISSLNSGENGSREGGDGSSLDEDEIPLQKIRVRTETEIKWEGSSKN